MDADGGGTGAAGGGIGVRRPGLGRGKIGLGSNEDGVLERETKVTRDFFLKLGFGDEECKEVGWELTVLGWRLWGGLLIAGSWRGRQHAV